MIVLRFPVGTEWEHVQFRGNKDTEHRGNEYDNLHSPANAGQIKQKY